jgi:2-amino-4-hydroxy-6-hydroxymethyldihydropteridine diphosphokinase
VAEHREVSRPGLDGPGQDDRGLDGPGRGQDGRGQDGLRQGSSLPLVWLPAYVALGSNLAQPDERVREAAERLAGIAQTRLEVVSSLYLTRPMGPQDQPDFVNAVAGVLTRLPARGLLDALLGIERAMGRNRQQRWGPRIIDLDLVWMLGETIAEPGLTLPHPGVSERNFVLYPLAEIAPTLEIPGHGRVLALRTAVGSEGISRLDIHP